MWPHHLEPIEKERQLWAIFFGNSGAAASSWRCSPSCWGCCWCWPPQAGVPRWFLLPGLLLAALGLWLFTAPESAILLVQFSVAAVLLFHGVLDVQGANSLRRLGLRRWGVDLALGIVTLLLGAVVLLNPFGTMKALVVLIGLSLVYDGASDLYLIYRVSKAFRDGGDL